MQGSCLAPARAVRLAKDSALSTASVLGDFIAASFIAALPFPTASFVDTLSRCYPPTSFTVFEQMKGYRDVKHHCWKPFQTPSVTCIHGKTCMASSVSEVLTKHRERRVDTSCLWCDADCMRLRVHMSEKRQHKGSPQCARMRRKEQTNFYHRGGATRSRCQSQSTVLLNPFC